MTAGWQHRSLGEVCNIRPPKSEARERLSGNDEVSFVPMEDLGIDQKVLQPTQIRRFSDVSGSYTYFAEGDVLLAKITPCFENGKLGIAAELKNGIGFGSSEFMVVRPSELVSKEWLYYYFSRESFRQEGVERMTGAVGHKRISKEFIEAYQIPIPPLPEQKRIVAILDEAFEGIAAARANSEKNVQRAGEMFRSYRAKAFASHADNWIEVRLDETSQNLDSKRVPITKGDRVAGEYPYYGASGIVDYVTDYIFDGDSLLVSEDGANLLARSTPIAFSVSGKYWVNNHAHILKFPDMGTQRYAEHYLESIPLDRYVTGAAQPKLTQKALNSIPIPIPTSVEERAEIVRRLDAFKEESDSLHDSYRRKIGALDDLKKSLLHHAFSGQL